MVVFCIDTHDGFFYSYIPHLSAESRVCGGSVCICVCVCVWWGWQGGRVDIPG